VLSSTTCVTVLIGHVLTPYYYKVSTHALSTLYESQWNKPLKLPLTEDITRLHKYLNTDSEGCQSAGINASVWYRPAQVILSQIILFNRRRSGEAAGLLLEDYRRIMSSEMLVNDDDEQSLSRFQQELC
jgi:hypothetical protein